MSRSLNRAQIIGNLGTEPELRALANGMAVGRLSVATCESMERQEHRRRPGKRPNGTG